MLSQEAARKVSPSNALSIYNDSFDTDEEDDEVEEYDKTLGRIQHDVYSMVVKGRLHCSATAPQQCAVTYRKF